MFFTGQSYEITIDAITFIESTKKLGSEDILRCLEPSAIVVKETDNNTPLSPHNRWVARRKAKM